VKNLFAIPTFISEIRKTVDKNTKNVWWDKTVTFISHKKIEDI